MRWTWQLREELCLGSLGCGQEQSRRRVDRPRRRQEASGHTRRGLRRPMQYRNSRSSPMPFLCNNSTGQGLFPPRPGTPCRSRRSSLLCNSSRRLAQSPSRQACRLRVHGRQGKARTRSNRNLLTNSHRNRSLHEGGPD